MPLLCEPVSHPLSYLPGTLMMSVSCTTLMFADDTALITIEDEPTMVAANLEKDLNTINDYFASLTLKLTIDMTKIMHKGWKKRNTVREYPIRIGRNRVGEVLEFKYLGLIIDSSLKFTQQIESNITNFCLEKSGHLWIMPLLP